jgi:flagellar hook-associated protein FlgK
MKRMPHSKLLAKKLVDIQNAWDDCDRYPSNPSEIERIDLAIQALTPEIRKQFEQLQLSAIRLSKAIGEHIEVPEINKALDDLQRAVDTFTCEDGDKKK